MRSFFTLFISICFSLISVAQTQYALSNDDEIRAYSNYLLIKGNLPDYFLSYTLGGANNNESHLDFAALRARAYVVPIPVLITGQKDNSFDIWVNSFKTIEKETIIKVSTMLTPEEKLALEQVNSFKDSATIAKEKYKKEILLKEAKKKEAEIVKEKPKTKDKKIQVLDAENTPIPLSSFSLLPDTIKTILKEKGEELGYKWLYEQQVIAGNVLFCEPKTFIPIALTIEGDEAINNYYTTLKAWKRAYASIWSQSTIEQHILIQKDIDAYFGQFGKNSSINNDFNQHLERHQFLLKTITP